MTNPENREKKILWATVIFLALFLVKPLLTQAFLPPTKEQSEFILPGASIWEQPGGQEIPNGISGWLAVHKARSLAELKDIYILTQEGEMVKVLGKYINLYDKPFWEDIARKAVNLWRTIAEGNPPYDIKVQRLNGTEFWYDVDKWDGRVYYKKEAEQSKPESITVVEGTIPEDPQYLWNKIDLPQWEKDIIEQVADEYGLTGDNRLLLYVIRKVENGRQGREFGVLNPDAMIYEHGNPIESFRLQAQWAAGTIQKRFTGDLIAFANRWAPIGADSDPEGLNRNWYPNALRYMNEWRRG